MFLEFFSSDNIYIGAIAIAALAAAMTFFGTHLKEEIEQTKKEIQEKNKKKDGKAHLHSDTIKTLNDGLDSALNQNQDNVKLVHNTTKFILSTISGLTIDWLGRNLIPSLTYGWNIPVVFLIILIVFKMIVVLYVVFIGKRLLEYRKGLKTIRAVRDEVKKLFVEEIDKDAAVKAIARSLELPK